MVFITFFCWKEKGFVNNIIVIFFSLRRIKHSEESTHQSPVSALIPGSGSCQGNALIPCSGPSPGPSLNLAQAPTQSLH